MTIDVQIDGKRITNLNPYTPLYISLIIPVLVLFYLESLATMPLVALATDHSTTSPSYNTLPLQIAYMQSSVQGTVKDESTDVFGVTKIYPTKEGGREWFLNMSSPKDSPNFSITNSPNLTKLPDGSWRINASHVRMIVNTSENQNNWKNVEMTGYVRLSYLNDSQKNSANNITDLIVNQEDTSNIPDSEERDDDLVFISRSGRHSSEAPCEGTAYNGVLHIDGSVGWTKEIWHTGGYTDERASHTVAGPIVGKWVGWKVVAYDIELDNNKTTAVKVESYLDLNESNTPNNWTKVTELIDSGGWYANTNNSMFFSAECDKSKDHILASAGPLIIFRTDNLILDFKNLSIREIQPPNSFSGDFANVIDLVN